MALKSNPGGNIPLEGILGRDALAASAWNILDVQSLLITAERRVGKTSLLRKMAAEPPPNWIVVSKSVKDLEHIKHAADFALAIYEDVEQHLSRWQRTARSARELLTNLGGTEVGGIVKLPNNHKTPWKALLTQSIQDLAQEQQNTKLVFFWDEVPYMLQKIAAQEGETVAMEILDVLRKLRQEHDAFRIVLTGSIGLHHVITKLNAQGYTSAPVNDMYKLEVPPLALADARELAQSLIVGEELACESPQETADAIAHAADCIPFYIHHIVRQLKLDDLPANPQTAANTVESQLLDVNDPWHFRHYRDRLDTYYPGAEKLVVAILDVLATAKKPLKTDDILKLVATTIMFDDRDRLLELLHLLERDHYLHRSTSGYAWKFPLIARWWRLDRDLPEAGA